MKRVRGSGAGRHARSRSSATASSRCRPRSTPGADIVLLDNMSLDDLRESVESARGRAKTEASGGVNLKTVRAIAETGVDRISVGALTHSAPALDLALDFD